MKLSTVEFVLYMALVALLVGTLHAQETQPEPGSPHDPHSRCMRPDVARGYGPAPFQILECECHRICQRPGTDETYEPYEREDPACRKFCAKSYCLCQPDYHPCNYEDGGEV